MNVTTAQGMELAWLQESPKRAVDEVILDVQHLVVKVGIRRVIDGLSFSMRAGEVVTVSGPNGSGKSTLLNAIAGTDPARIEDGKIFFLDTDISLMTAHDRSALGISYMMQRNNVFEDLTVDQNLQLALGANGWQHLAGQFPTWSEELPRQKRVGLLSGGQKQKLAWAMASLRPAKLLLADEPEVGIAEGLAAPKSRTMLQVIHLE